jgi:HSP20 family protein
MNEIRQSNHRLRAALAAPPAAQWPNGEADWFPPVDILEDEQEYLFKVDLPEVKPEDVSVTVERDGLLISGQRPARNHDQKTCLRRERPHGYFERRFALPDDASRSDIEAAFSNSVLELRVRKVRRLASNGTPADTPAMFETQCAC